VANVSLMKERLKRRFGSGSDNSQKASMLRVSTHGTSTSMFVGDMPRNKCFSQVRISHVLRFLSICGLFTDFSSYIETTSACFLKWVSSQLVGTTVIFLSCLTIQCDSDHDFYWIHFDTCHAPVIPPGTGFSFPSICILFSESQSDLLYDWRFTANQFILATSPLRLTTQ
jgi:hypothetical protein